MADKKIIHRKRTKEPDSYRTLVKKISVSESDLQILIDRANQVGMRLATYCYRVLMGKRFNLTDIEHKKARIAVVTIIGNFTQICNHSNVEDLLSSGDIALMKKISKVFGSLIICDVYTRPDIMEDDFNLLKIEDNNTTTFHLCDAKKRNPKNKRLLRLKISISEKDYVLLSTRAENLNLKLAQYMYYRVMSGQLKFVPQIDTKILQKYAAFAKDINAISHRYNIENTLSNRDVEALVKIIHQIIHV